LALAMGDAGDGVGPWGMMNTGASDDILNETTSGELDAWEEGRGDGEDSTSFPGAWGITARGLQVPRRATGISLRLAPFFWLLAFTSATRVAKSTGLSCLRLQVAELCGYAWCR